MNKNRQVNNINKTQFFYTIIPLIRELDGQTLKSTLQNRENDLLTLIVRQACVIIGYYLKRPISTIS